MRFRSAIITSLAVLSKELSEIFRDLTFSDNFKSFQVTEIIAANTEIKVRNKLTIRPTKYIILYQTGNALVTAGDTLWTDDYLYIKNHDSTNSATVTITFLK